MTSEQTVRSETPICVPHYLVLSVNQARTLDALINAIWPFNRQLEERAHLSVDPQRASARVVPLEQRRTLE